MLARMWIECDPNRGGPGCEPDDIIDQPNSSYHGKPRWTWFGPRAEASLEFFTKHGYKLVKE